MAERFGNFYIDHVPRQQNADAYALASIAASLALPTGVIEKVLVYSHDLYCPRIASKDHQNNQEKGAKHIAEDDESILFFFLQTEGRVR